MNLIRSFLMVSVWLCCMGVLAQDNVHPASSSATATSPAGPDVCSPLVAKSLSNADFVKAVHDPINVAIETLDNAKIEFSSPILPSGKLNYLTVSPNFADSLTNICVVGYFQIGRTPEGHSLPLEIDHIEVVKIPNPSDATQSTNSTRLFFRTPHIREFPHGNHNEVIWKFWARNEPAFLYIAAFNYQNGQRVKPYFGRSFHIIVSQQNTSIFAAFVFALCCYMVAAITISYRADRKQEILPSSMSGLRIFLRKLSPWYVVGSSGQASLSQLQMLLFTLIVATLLFYQWLRTGLLQEISTDLLYLIGISTAGAGGAQITQSIKKNLDPEVYNYVQQLGWFTAPMKGAHSSAHPSELLLSNNCFDIYKFQMLLFTVVIAAYVVAAGANELGNIQISSTLLTLMGISQGAYMGGHAATDSLTPLQDQLRGMQALQQCFLDATGDAELQNKYSQRFKLAAQQASDMFSAIFGREVPPWLLEMPPLAKTAVSPEKAAESA